MAAAAGAGGDGLAGRGRPGKAEPRVELTSVSTQKTMPSH